MQASAPHITSKAIKGVYAYGASRKNTAEPARPHPCMSLRTKVMLLPCFTSESAIQPLILIMTNMVSQGAAE